MRTIILVSATAIVTATLTSAAWLVFTPDIIGHDPASRRAASLQMQHEKKIARHENRYRPDKPGVQARVLPPPQAPSTIQIASDARIGKDPDDVLAKHLTIPVQGIRAEDLRPDFYDDRGQRGHEAIDIVAGRGQPVLAVEDGKIAKLFTSVRGGLTIYQFDPSGKYAYYYAHLDRYAAGVSEGDSVTRGEVIGYVGSTGNADPSSPHLHFAIFVLGPEKQWWRGEAIDPYPALARQTPRDTGVDRWR